MKPCRLFLTAAIRESPAAAEVKLGLRCPDLGGVVPETRVE
jgi:hypothetical protein